MTKIYCFSVLNRTKCTNPVFIDKNQFILSEKYGQIFKYNIIKNECIKIMNGSDMVSFELMAYNKDSHILYTFSK